MTVVKKKKLTKEQTLAIELKEALRLVEYYKKESTINYERGDRYEDEAIAARQQLKDYKAAKEGARDAVVNGLENEVRRLTEIIRWNVNPQTAECQNHPDSLMNPYTRGY